jgi:Integrase core domain
VIFSRRQLEQVLRVFVRHYNTQRPHRALDSHRPDRAVRLSTIGQPPGSTVAAIRRRDLLGRLIHEYEAVAA